jgi:hypothetical protein
VYHFCTKETQRNAKSWHKLGRFEIKSPSVLVSGGLGTGTLKLQRRGMESFHRTVWMPCALPANHSRNGGKCFTAIFAGVLTLFRAFVQFVSAFVCAVGMPCALSAGQGRCRGKLFPAVFAIIIRHILYILKIDESG